MEVFDRWRTWDDARAGLAEHPALDADRIGRAAHAAVRRHGDQTRPTGAPYLEHLLEALEVLVRGAGETDPDVLAAVLLHDVVEDTPATVADVEDEFGPRVAELVDWVTKPRRVARDGRRSGPRSRRTCAGCGTPRPRPSG